MLGLVQPAQDLLLLVTLPPYVLARSYVFLAHPHAVLHCFAHCKILRAGAAMPGHRRQGFRVLLVCMTGKAKRHHSSLMACVPLRGRVRAVCALLRPAIGVPAGRVVPQVVAQPAGIPAAGHHVQSKSSQPARAPVMTLTPCMTWPCCPSAYHCPPCSLQSVSKRC